MRLKTLLEKRDAFKTVTVKEISNDEKNIIKNFIELLKYTYDFFQDKDKNVQKYNEFKRDIVPYLREPYAKPIVNRITQIDNELQRIGAAKNRVTNVLKDFNDDIKKLEKLFYSKNFGASASFARVVNRKIDALKNASRSPEKEVKEYKNPFRKADPIIFQSAGLLRSFEFDEMEKMINKDYSKFKYSYLNFPATKLKDYEYLVYWIQHLQDSKKKVDLSYDLYNKWTEFLFLDNESFGELKKIVDDYLHGGNKKLIPDILAKLKEFPELYKTNEKLKKSHSIVYRGVGGYGGEDEKNEPSKKQVIDADKKARYVATSVSKYTAEKFAKMIGHLESGRRSDWGYVLAYKVNPSAIVLDTQIFGSIYGEDEILIDVTKAQLEDVRSLGPKGYEDED
jgi:hypothetical protein